MNKKIISLTALVFFLLAIAVAWVWWSVSGGVSHQLIWRTVAAEGAQTRKHVNLRADALELRADALEAKLDRIEKKLDRILELATPRLSDGMRPVP